MAKENSKERQHSSDIFIESIKIKKMGGDQEYVVVEKQKKEKDEKNNIGDTFVSLSITESIFNVGVVGILKFREPIEGGSMTGDYFNFIGGELVEIIIESPDIENSKKTLTFCVDDVKKLGDEAEESLGGPSGRASSGWELNFITCENFYLNWAEIDVAKEEDYIGHIAKWGSSFDDNPGLVNQLAEKYFNPGATDYSFSKNDMEIEDTHNSVWIKKNQHMYPWGKDVHHSNLMSMITDLTENAVTTDGKGVNYLFYADLDGWHFKSIRKILADEAGSYFFGILGKDPREYAIIDMDISPDEWNFGNPRIVSMRMLTEFNHLKLWNDGAYSAYYELVKPNYDDPYFDYLDFTSTHQKSGGNFWGEREIIKYNYHDIEDMWDGLDDGGRVERYKILPDIIDTSIEIDENNGNVSAKSRRIYDDLYGYFGNSYNAPYYTSSDVLGAMHGNGKDGVINDIVWRTMFDQTDLEGEILYKIQNEIKKPLRESQVFEKYTQIKNLKERWTVYKRSICCDKESIDKFTFLAVIEDAEKISEDGDRGGIYEYTWREVEIWPKDQIVELEIGAEVISDETSPIKIVASLSGLRGTYSDSESEEWTNPAYNINELMNKTEGNDVFVGPGVNVADDDYNDYPEAYQMMPVGGYFKVGDDPCEIMEDGEGVYFHKHIVQMYKLPNYVLNAITPKQQEAGEEPDPSIPDEIYFFDVPNAHDGMCGCG